MPRALQSLNKLLTQLQVDYPQFHFAIGSSDRWDSNGTVYYTAETSRPALLHELAHALLGHSTYQLDIELLRMERSAWDHAQHTLAPHYGVTMTNDDVQDALDTYRYWLHNRSLYPDCHLSGLQQSDGDYRCVGCSLTWRANAAKTCALRRFKQPQLK